MSDPNNCDSWDNELIYDVINVLEATRDGELHHVDVAHLVQSRMLGLMKDNEMTENGKLLLLGWSASQSITEVSTGLLLCEIENLKKKSKED
jgi:hypothetical protein